MATETIGVDIVERSANTNALIKAVRDLAGELDRLGPKEEKSTNDTRKFGNEAEVAGRKTGGFSAAVKGATGGFSAFQGAIAGVLGVMSIKKMIDYADTYTNIGNKMGLATRNQKEYNTAMQSSFSIAQNTRTKFEDVAGVYGKVTDTLRNMNRSTSDAAKITDTIAKSVAMSGSSAEAAANGLRQFEQGLAAGALRGDEFNSVVENTNGLAKAIAEGMGVPTGALRGLAEAGALTSEVLINALDKANGKISASFKTFVPTIQQAYVVLENAALQYIGSANQQAGVTGLLAKGMIGLASNINIVVPALIALGGAVALVAISALVGQVYSLGVAFTGLVVGMAPLIASFGAWLLAMSPILIPLAALAAAVYYFRDSLSDVISWIVDVGQALANAFGYGEQYAKTVDNMRKKITDLTNAGKEVAKSLGVAGEAAQKTFTSFGDMTGATKKATVDLNKLNAEAQKSGDFYNSFGEKVYDASKKVKDSSTASAAATTSLNALGDQVKSTSATQSSLKSSTDAATSSISAQSAAADGNASALRRMANEAAAASAGLSQLGEVQARNSAIGGAGNTAGMSPADSRFRSSATNDNYSPSSGSKIDWSFDGGEQFGSFGKGPVTAGSFTTYIGAPSTAVGSKTLIDGNSKNMLLLTQKQQKAFYEEMGILSDDLKAAAQGYIQAFNSSAEEFSKFYGNAISLNNFGSSSYEIKDRINKLNQAVQDKKNREKQIADNKAKAEMSNSNTSTSNNSNAAIANRPIQIVIQTPDYNSMRQSQSQIARDGFRELLRKVG